MGADGVGSTGKFVWILTTVAVAVAIGFVLCVINDQWVWLTSVPDGGESGSATVRNLGLVGFALVGLPLAVWRSIVSARQASTALRSSLNEQYQRGAEMLGHATLAVRLGGIHALQALAEEYPEHYHLSVLGLFCSFAQNPPEGHRENGMPPKDVESVVQLIGRRSGRRRTFEQAGDGPLHLDLMCADLTDIGLGDLCLAHAAFNSANLQHVRFDGSDLTAAWFNYADLSGATFCGARLEGADFTNAVLSGARFVGDHGESPAMGVTQAQLDVAVAKRANPPRLEGLKDMATGLPIKWQGTDV